MNISAEPAPAAPGLDEFRARVREVLATLADPLPVDNEGRPIAPGAFAIHASDDHDQLVVDAKSYQRALAEAGLAGLSLPAEYGGQGLGEAAERAFLEEAGRFALPPLQPLTVGLSLVVPTLLAHGTEEQKAQHVAATLRGEETWCQLFSEPGAGSDLASLATKARLDGDVWVVDGQKVWTSFADHADHGILLARTRTDGPRHAGITMFIVPMDLDGIEVRPLREMTGGTHFSEVFLNEVRLPVDAVMGEEGAGWKVAMTTLGSERTAGGFDRASRSQALIRQVRALGRQDDPLVRDQLARLWTLERMHGILGRRVQAETDTGRPPIWGGSALKLGHGRIEQTAARMAVLLGGPDAVAWDPDDAQGPRLAFELLYSRMWTIAGGSDEIQRNILAERALGLPKEPK